MPSMMSKLASLHRSTLTYLFKFVLDFVSLITLTVLGLFEFVSDCLFLLIYSLVILSRLFQLL